MGMAMKPETKPKRTPAPGWRPIETAVKECAEILVMDINAERPEAMSAWWSDADKCWSCMPLTFVVRGAGHADDCTCTPTHWQPFPAALA